MEAYTLVVSNPPHNEVNARQAAPCFGLPPAEARMKANYPVPEIWLADTDKNKMEEAAQALREAGLNVVVVASEELANFPPQVKVKSFSFADSHLLVSVEDTDVELPYDAAITAVFCKPREQAAEERHSIASSGSVGFGRRVFMTSTRSSMTGLEGRSSMAGSGTGDQAESSAFLDVYAPGDGGLKRISIFQDVVDFSGLGELKLARATDNLAMFVAEFEDRFTQATVDRRMEKARVRNVQLVRKGTPQYGHRRGFSYATESLYKLLESVSPELKRLSQFELGSRLAYLTRR